MASWSPADGPLYERSELLDDRRVRLYFRLPDGSQRAVVARQADDGPELRARAAQLLAAEQVRHVGGPRGPRG